MLGDTTTGLSAMGTYDLWKELKEEKKNGERFSDGTRFTVFT